MKKKIYLIPNFLSESECAQNFPPINQEIVQNIRIFFVETPKIARAFLKKLCPQLPLADCLWIGIGKHENLENAQKILIETDQNQVGIISDAGFACIADPGSVIVDFGHQKGWEICPLIGPSSIFLALAASGFSGQNFSFYGYLPIEKVEKKQKLKQIEKNILQQASTHIFIETPFRNQSIFESILESIHEEISLCIACEITSKNQWIQSKKIKDWKKIKPELEKKNCIFLLGK